MRISRVVLVSTGCVAIYGMALMSGLAGKSHAQHPPLPQTAPVVAPNAGLEALPAVPSEPQPAPNLSEPPGVPVPIFSRAIANQDPEKVALDFVEKNKRIADQELAKLKAEAETLRTRLLKVEAGIRRWEAVAQALKQSEGVASRADGSWKPESFPRNSGIEFDIENPSDLEAIPARGDRASVPASPKAKVQVSTPIESDLQPLPVAPGSNNEQHLLPPTAPSSPTEASKPKF